MIQRQGLNVTVKQLRKLADKIEAEHNNLVKELGIVLVKDATAVISIINKSKCSDTWEIEK